MRRSKNKKYLYFSVTSQLEINSTVHPDELCSSPILNFTLQFLPPSFFFLFLLFLLLGLLPVCPPTGVGLSSVSEASQSSSEAAGLFSEEGRLLGFTSGPL